MYLLRRSAIFDALDGQSPGRVLEVGCGAGALLYDLRERGYTGIGVEVSDRARMIANEVLGADQSMEVCAQIPSGPSESFDLVMAFEVLEHIENDREALMSWLRLLKPGGRLIISVPALRRRWNVTDLLVGHYRRYDRDDVASLLEGVGLEIESISTIGWPASWLIERVRVAAKGLQARAGNVDVDAITRGDSARTQNSGIERSLEARFFPLYASRAGRMCLAHAAKLQRRFYGTDLGVSFLARAMKPERS
jgi:SAM-dependent methyltransferase